MKKNYIGWVIFSGIITISTCMQASESYQSVPLQLTYGVILNKNIHDEEVKQFLEKISSPSADNYLKIADLLRDLQTAAKSLQTLSNANLTDDEKMQNKYPGMLRFFHRIQKTLTEEVGSDQWKEYYLLGNMPYNV